MAIRINKNPHASVETWGFYQIQILKIDGSTKGDGFLLHFTIGSLGGLVAEPGAA